MFTVERSRRHAGDSGNQRVPKTGRGGVLVFGLGRCTMLMRHRPAAHADILFVRRPFALS